MMNPKAGQRLKADLDALVEHFCHTNKCTIRHIGSKLVNPVVTP